MVQNQRHVFVITGAAGSGKTTVSNYLQQHFKMAKIITHTTRPPRQHERNNIDYYFESPASFAQKHYLETVTYAGHQYGSSYEGLQRAFQKSNQACIVLDTQGAAVYRHKLGSEAVVIFLRVHQERILQQRMYQRGDNAQKIEQRLQSPEYLRDLQLPAELADYAQIIDNDDWQKTQQALNQLVARYVH